MAIAWMMTLNGKFEFTYKEGKPFLKVLDTSIKRVAAPCTCRQHVSAGHLL